LLATRGQAPEFTSHEAFCVLQRRRKPPKSIGGIVGDRISKSFIQANRTCGANPQSTLIMGSN
jgi:hypothetical protein